ncbi:hypothetical protein E0H26_01730 [Micromonospora zingiberis]|uniref:DUF7144 domain-containing protein n=1 Tax=Micromonospora zingiberis TaxID=2053011 RepID=A0A4R0GRZ1_9ACTN|nr:hypothetical protein [Micromonospora zingiberis]TCC00437.1 hypothetical protein E0H26_01730 [Micromonospora zingiberis]
MDTKVGSHGPATERRTGDRRLLSGLCLGVAGAFDVVVAAYEIAVDPYVVVDEAGFHNLDVTGWTWLRLGVGVVMVLSALALTTGRRVVVLVAIGAGVAGIVTAALLFPFQPGTEAISLVLAAVAVWLLVGQARRRSPRQDQRRR